MFSADSSQFYIDRQAGDAAAATAPPPFRRLRGYAFDPSLSLHLDTASINRTTFEAPWERQLKPGPVGEYLEVLDVDPASGCWYEPVDLNDVDILAQEGLPPSEGNPQFHQQMVYAAAMNTIARFEHALGRQIFWAAQYHQDRPSGQRDEYVQRLRIYPHAMRAANAYYSPNKRALLFGYFAGSSGMVFSCLSHDIIAHETTHALLDGMHRRYIADNHEDSLAFHEAFADLVALFQHFSFREVLRHQIAQTRGDLTTESLLGELARQFGEATGRYGALRSAIGERDERGQWHLIEPDPARLEGAVEPHDRGAVLVAAVFAAFLATNRARTQDLIRIATSGTGVLPSGAIHPDLVNRLAEQTGAIANNFLNICIRALDYCPPVDMTFGDYLRALVTADFDLVPNDRHGYRVALIESFRRWGILPKGLRTLSEEQLRWPFVKMACADGWEALNAFAARIRPEIADTLYVRDRSVLFRKLCDARALAHDLLKSAIAGTADDATRTEFDRITGLRLWRTGGLDGLRTDSSGLPHFEVHSLRPVLRVSPDGVVMKQMVVILNQHREVPVDPACPEKGTFEFLGGSTLVFDLEHDPPSVRYAVARPIDDEARLKDIRAYRARKSEDSLSLRHTYFGSDDGSTPGLDDEPLSMLHAEG